MKFSSVVLCVTGASFTPNCSPYLDYSQASGQRLGSYIISVKPGYSHAIKAAAVGEVIRAGGRITHDYTIIDGFAALMPSQLHGLFKASCYYSSAINIESDSYVTLN
ncbi:hypothetical protein DSO57_1038195 [Entomophthora muscae]|uniref:Uncharacterized protein n=1 Tax=Entomophthora muscae TaxID=34485 RepID=A0ACC2SMX2_9FUNG|nr:hypothetical protein DSO57_1038195 [Entomophthora muscae]